MANYFNPSMIDNEDLMKKLSIKNPEAQAIDNSPGFLETAIQGLITTGLEAAGGPMGKAVGESFASSMNGEKMPGPGQVAQQEMVAGPMNYVQQGPLADTSQQEIAHNRVAMLGDNGNVRPRYDKDGKLIPQRTSGYVPFDYTPIMDYQGSMV